MYNDASGIYLTSNDELGTASLSPVSERLNTVHLESRIKEYDWLTSP